MPRPERGPGSPREISSGYAGKKGTLQIEYGLLTDPAGRPVPVRVFRGNTGDPGAFTAIADVVRKKFRLGQMVMVSDRGMITSARIQALNRYSWEARLDRAPQVLERFSPSSTACWRAFANMTASCSARRPVSVRGSPTGHAGALPRRPCGLQERCLVRPVR
jgi:hypothetical protein